LEWNVQASLLGQAVVTNQSTSFEVTANLTDDIAGVTISLKNPLPAINNAIKATVALEDGTYFAQNDDGIFTYVVVDGGKVAAVFLDQIEASEQATIKGRDGVVYPLFTYDVQRVFGSTVEGTPKVVYQDRGVYYELENGRVPATPDRVTFVLNELSNIDEEATLAPIPGYTTSQMLGDAWLGETRLFSAALAGETNPYVFNITADGTTNTETTVPVPGYAVGSKELPILNALVVRDLIEEALLQSADAKVAVAALVAPTPAQVAAAAAPFQYAPASNDYNPGAITAAQGEGIANGFYFGAAPANEDGDILFGYGVVVKNQLRHFIIEGTRLVDGEVVLMSQLGDDEYEAVGELEDGKDDFYELIPQDIEKFLGADSATKTVVEDQHELIQQVAAGYDFSSRAVFGIPTISPSGYSTRFGAETFLVAEDLIKNALPGMVAEQAAAAALVFSNPISTKVTSTRPLFSQQTGAGKLITLAANTNFYGNLVFSRLSFESSNRDVLDIANDGFINVRNLTADGFSDVKMTLEFGDQVFTYTTRYTAKTVESYNLGILNALHTRQLAASATAANDPSIEIAGARVLQGISVPLETPASSEYSTYSVAQSPYVTGSGNAILTGVSTPTFVPVVAIGSGITSGLLTASGSVANFGWYVNYGQSTQKSITNLNELTAGSYVLTAVILYDRAATPSPLEVSRRVNVTILSEVDAVALVSAAIKPGTLLPNGQITSEAKVDLLRYSSEVIGVYVDWALVNSAGAPAQPTNSASGGLLVASVGLKAGGGAFQLDPTRNYTDEKIFLRASILKGLLPVVTTDATSQTATQQGTFTGSPQSNFEFTVKANPVSEIGTRIEAKLATWMALVPSSVPLTVGTDGATELIVNAAQYASGIELLRTNTLTAPATNVISDTPDFRYAITTTEAGYYVLPAFVATADPSATALATYNTTTLSGISYYVVFKIAGANPDLGSGFARIDGNPAQTYEGDSGITIVGAEVTNDYPFLVINAVSGEVRTYEAPSPDDVVTAALAFPGGSRAVDDFTFTVVGRVLLSTDTVAETKQVNSSKITKEVTLYRDPVFQNTDSISLATLSGVGTDSGFSIDITLAANQEFVNRPLLLNDFIFEGVSTTGLTVVRLDQNKARISGFTATTSGTASSGVSVAAKALRQAANNNPPTSVTQVNNFGIAEVTANIPVAYTSGATATLTSGISFTVKLSRDAFEVAADHLSSGVNFLNSTSGIVVKIDGATVDTGSGLQLMPQFAATAPGNFGNGSGLQTVTFILIGTLDDATSLDELDIELTIKAAALFGSTVDINVLVSREAISLQPRSRLFLEVVAPE
jgi:hypothetical protein